MFAFFDVPIVLIHPVDSPEEDEKTSVYAELRPIGRDEFQAAGVNGYKAESQYTIWANEYDGQPEIEADNKRLTIYRTYGPRKDGKMELYAAERVGNYGR